MTDLQPVDRLIVPGTGEVFDVTLPTEAARALLALTDHKQTVETAILYVADLLWQEGERLGSKTLHFDECDVELYGGTRTEWDVEKLRDLLSAAGLPQAQLDELIKTEVKFKVDANRARWTAGANPAYAKAIDASSELVPTARRARVKR